MDTGSTLRAARDHAGLSQREVAARAHVTVPVLSAYENGRREPAAATFLRIMSTMGVTPRWRQLPDPSSCADRLLQVLSLGESLPYRARPLTVPRAPWIS